MKLFNLWVSKENYLHFFYEERRVFLDLFIFDIWCVFIYFCVSNLRCVMANCSGGKDFFAFYSFL